MRITILLFLALLFVGQTKSTTSSVITGPDEFIVCIVQGNYDQAKATTLADEFKKAFPIKACRFDASTKKFLVMFENAKIESKSVTNFFSKNGLKATCLFKGVQGVDQLPSLKADDCK